jgi:hypothetical protein
MPDNTVKLPQEAIDAWVDYDPPEFKHQSSALRHAFMSGFLAGRPNLDDASIDVEDWTNECPEPPEPLVCGFCKSDPCFCLPEGMHA